MRRLLIVTLLLLTSCGDSDVKKFIKETEKTKGPVEPLPVVTKFKTYKYEAANIRSPFGETIPEQVINHEAALAAKEAKPATPIEQKKSMQVSPQDVKLLENNPERYRQRAYLEQFSLTNLQYVGNMRLQNYAWALIVDPKGVLHHLQVGDYLGLRNGMIKEISDQKIVIRELMPRADGRWESSEVELKLTTAQQKNGQTDKGDS